VVDEAQELAPLELALLGRCVARGGSLIVAGDSAQQVDSSADFRGWDATMRELGAPEHRKAILEVSYRCPPEVTRFARALRADVGQAAFPLARFHDECHLAAWLVEALRDLDAEDPTAASAVICRTPQAAAQLARLVKMALPAQLALEGAFTFGPGAQVTCVPEVKGLEFDHVVIPDAGAGRYAPPGPWALHVAATAPRRSSCWRRRGTARRSCADAGVSAPELQQARGFFAFAARANARSSRRGNLIEGSAPAAQRADGTTSPPSPPEGGGAFGHLGVRSAPWRSALWRCPAFDSIAT
jgi:hypothetical protein